MQKYTYSEARQNLATVLAVAESSGKVLIQRRDGRTFALVPETAPSSPLDVPMVRSRVSTRELVALVKNERKRARGVYVRR